MPANRRVARHLEVKRLGRFERLGHRIIGDRTACGAIAFLKAAVAYCRKLGITVTRLMTENDSCYVAKDFAKACKAFGLTSALGPTNGTTS